MPIKGPPDIEKLAEKHNIRGLIKALTYEKDSRIEFAAAHALIQLGKTARKEKNYRILEIMSKYRNKPGKERRHKLEMINDAIFPEFSAGPRSEMQDRMLHPKDYKKTKGQYTSTPLHIPKKDE